MSELEKLESHKYVLVPRWKHLVMWWTIILTILSAMVYVIKKDELTFDSHQQKQRFLSRFEAAPVLTESQRDRILDHMVDENVHMSNEEKRRLIIMEQVQIKVQENQVKIGQDLQEIKGLLRQR